jgi:short-subunit dehydrogenase
MSAPNRTLRQNRFRDQYGPWAVVSGASSGIGREIALRLAASGLNLILVARRQDLLEEVASELSGRNGMETRVIAVDLATTAGIEAVVAGSRDLDVGLLVAAAGFGISGPFLESDLTQELEMLDVNCRALLSQSLHFGRRFAERGRGGLILLASLVGFQGTPFSAHYAATKAYVQSLAEALHVELAPHGVDVLASAPGPVQSGFAARAGMQFGVAVKPTEVAQATLDALGCKTTVVPGLLSKILTYSLVPLPRSSRVRMMGRIMRAMTKHRDETTPSKDPKLA